MDETTILVILIGMLIGLIAGMVIAMSLLRPTIHA